MNAVAVKRYALRILRNRLTRAICMNLADKTCSMIPEAQCAMSSAQKPAAIAGVSDVGGIYTANLSALGGVELPVIARIPDLDAPRQPHRHRQHSHSRAVAKPASISGRLLSAGLSLNILLGLGLLLLIGAIVGGIQSKSNDTRQARQADANIPASDLAPAWIPLAGQHKSSSQVSPDAPSRVHKDCRLYWHPGKGTRSPASRTPQ